MMEALRGAKAMLETLAEIGKEGSKKAAKAGVNAGLAVLAKEIRTRVNGLQISGNLKAAIRKTVSKRLKKKEGDAYSGKAGFGIGKQSKAKKGAAAGRSYLGKIGTMRGRGISANNIHWAMGTRQRTTKSGHRTGAMPDYVRGVIAQAAESAGPAMLEAAAQKVTQVLASEAAKAKKG
jgi:hypothetical protein